MTHEVWVNIAPSQRLPKYHDRRSCGTGVSGAAQRASRSRIAAQFAGLDGCAFCTVEGKAHASANLGGLRVSA